MFQLLINCLVSPVCYHATFAVLIVIQSNIITRQKQFRIEFCVSCCTVHKHMNRCIKNFSKQYHYLNGTWCEAASRTREQRLSKT